MFLRCTRRRKDGKEHLYWSIVENRRLPGGKVLQRHVLYLGELNGRQEASWQKSIDLISGDQGHLQQARLFAEEYAPEEESESPDCTAIVRIRVSQMELRRPRQWGACWLGCVLWEQLGLGEFWREKLPTGREGARWDLILQTLVLYRLIDPGSEWRLHRQWLDRSAIPDLLGSDFSLGEIHRLYECHDHILKHKDTLFAHLRERWQNLFNVKYQVLLYDLTSTYFESDPPEDPADPRRFGYSRDKRSDCVQVVIALVVTPEGFPLAYEVMPGNTSDKTTLKGFLQKIEEAHGKADRIWIMDRGIPTEETLEEMRKSDPPVSYLVGTPKASLNKLENDLALQPWQQARDRVRVKLLPKEGETYVYAESKDRIAKERSMRRRRLRRYLAVLRGLRDRKHLLPRDKLHEMIGAAKKEAGHAARMVKLSITQMEDPAMTELPTSADVSQKESVATGRKAKKAKKAKAKKEYARLEYRIDRKVVREVWRREGRYLLRTNLNKTNPKQLWELYLILTEIEQAFKELKGDLSLRPIYHQLIDRIESHIFISFLSYCLQVTLKARLKKSAGGLTPRSALEKFSAVQMLDVHLPTTDGREVILTRYTQPEKELQLLLDQLKLTLPEQPPPRIQSTRCH